MKHHCTKSLIFTLIIFITISHSQSKPTKPFSDYLKINQTQNQFYQWNRETLATQLNFSPQIAIAALLCFIASSISSAGGIGGGGLFIPILTIVAGFDLKTASSFSAFMVTGGSIANVIYNLVKSSPKFGDKGKKLIDYDIALLSQPCMLLGVSFGVICNVMFPEWIITILFAVFLGFSSFKTCQSGFCYWNFETEEVRKKGVLRDVEGENGIDIKKIPLLNQETEYNLGIPLKKLGFLIVIWFLFFVLYLLRGNKYGQSILGTEVCGIGYWIISSSQIPLAVILTALILYTSRYHRFEKELDRQVSDVPSNDLVFSFMALLAGTLGGLFGIGGGMLISPLLLQVGISPEVTAATCSFMVFFSSSMSAVQYLLLGMEHTGGAILLSIVCFVASLVGLLVVQRAIRKHGRASIIIFSVGIVMVVSSVLITSFGALDVYRDYLEGNYMGFKRPC